MISKPYTSATIIDTAQGYFLEAYQHFTLMNILVQGDDALNNAEPTTLKREGKKKSHTSQTLPQPSQEMLEHSAEYEALRVALAPLLEWQKKMVRIHKHVFESLNFLDQFSQVELLLPQDYEELAQYVEILPCHQISPAYPFGGFVLNLNVSTLIHRDWKDLNLCMVIVISEDCIGGDLALLEPGLVLELRNGNAVLFPSGKISHFNTHYQGMRASLVFHSDSSSQGWIKDRNGWDGNIYFSSTQGSSQL